MLKKPIRDLHSDSPHPPRFCDVVVDGDKVYLEQKKGKDRYITITWDDIVYQVNVALGIKQ